jgi:hypothetical protein
MSEDLDMRSGDAHDVLAYWRAVELFSPQPVPARGDERVFELDDGPLPWEPGHPLEAEWIRSTNVWQHYMYVGVYSLDHAYEALRKVLSDEDEDENGDPPRAGESALAAFAVADDGRVILGSQTLSGCAWALGRAFTNGPQARTWLKGFERAERDFAQQFESLVGAEEDDQDACDLEEEGHRVGAIADDDLIDQLHELIVGLLGVEHVEAAAEIASARTIRVQSRPVGHANRYRLRSHDFLNSFIAGDLDTVDSAWADDTRDTALRRYLSGGQGADVGTRYDLDQLTDGVRGELAPAAVPLGRWPRAASQTADMGQQLAINLCLQIDADPDGIGRLLSVNGPPGTGKTTMLRDLIAALIVTRAERLAELETPADAFAAKPITFYAGRYRRSVYELQPSLTGHEIVLACATNAAAENVSREIPLEQAIAPEWQGRIDYFTDIATRMLRDQANSVEGESAQAWGLLAAPLGSLARCQAFASSFWFGPSPERGAREAEAPPEPGLMDVLKRHRPKPSSWEKAVAEFNAALERARTIQAERQNDAQRWKDLLFTQHDVEEHASKRSSAQAECAETERQLADLAGDLDASERKQREAADAHERHRDQRPRLPWLLAALRPAVRQWRSHERRLSETESRTRSELGDVRARRDELEHAIAQHTEQIEAHEQRWREASEHVEALRAQIAADAERWAREHPDVVYPDEDWADEAQRAYRELRAPWLDAAWDTARTETFLAALELHRAFVLGAAKQLRHGLGVAIDVLQDGRRGEIPEHAALAAWQSLFMVVPVISTTFASYPRLFRHLEGESLGWLLIDEAGQSSAQNAAGPIWRARNVLVVGDPMQLEPVVTLPLGTQRDLQRAHDVPDSLLPSNASVQSLADHVCPFGTYRGDDGELWVGSPLSVHRRCGAPMFEIVNELAYDGKMIDGTPEREEGLLPDSRWLHVASDEAHGHWIPAEGAVLERLLSEIATCGEPFPDVFLISPFRGVANRLSRYRTQHPLTAGTVHTTQGREADVVILVLGGRPHRTGDKRWASQRPNLLNVAVSRAKRRLYVIGNHDVWSRYRYFSTLAARLPVEGTSS